MGLYTRLVLLSNASLVVNDFRYKLHFLHIKRKPASSSNDYQKGTL